MQARTTLTAVAMTCLALASPANANELRLMTGPQGGVWVPLGGQLKDAWEKAIPGAKISALPGAGIANVRAIEEGKAEAGFGNTISTEAAPSDQTQLRKKSTTVAMDFGSIGIEADTQLHIYGAPGQRRFDFMSEILIKNALGIVILISNESSDSLNELNYYLNTHKEFLKHNRAVIGVTHNDINPNPSIGEYDRFIKGRGESWPVIKVDARKREDMKKLVMSLLISTLKHG